MQKIFNILNLPSHINKFAFYNIEKRHIIALEKPFKPLIIPVYKLCAICMYPRYLNFKKIFSAKRSPEF